MDVPQHINKRMHDYFKPSPKKCILVANTINVHLKYMYLQTLNWLSTLTDVDDYFKTPTNKRCWIQRKQIIHYHLLLLLSAKCLIQTGNSTVLHNRKVGFNTTEYTLFFLIDCSFSFSKKPIFSIYCSYRNN